MKLADTIVSHSKFFHTPLIRRRHTSMPLESGLTCVCFDPQSKVKVLQSQTQSQLLKGMSVSASLCCTLSHQGRSSTIPRPPHCEEAPASHVERPCENRETDPQPVPSCFSPLPFGSSQLGPQKLWSRDKLSPYTLFKFLTHRITGCNNTQLLV